MPSSRSVTITYLPLSNFIALFRGSMSHLRVKLLNSKPDVVKYIRKLAYKTGNYVYEPEVDYGCQGLSPSSDNVNYLLNEDNLLSPILPNLLRTIPLLNCLKIYSSKDSFSDWNGLDFSLKSAFLHLMHLPTINHLDLSLIKNFHCLVSVHLSTCVGSIYLT